MATTQTMRVEMNEEHMRKMLQPILDAVNEQRKQIEELQAKVALLEDEAMSHFAVAAELEIKLARMEDDGR